MASELHIPLYDPGQIIALTEEKSLLYRAHKLRLFNILRAVVMLMIVAGVLIADNNNALVLPGFKVTRNLNWFLTAVVVYLSILTFHWALSRRLPVAEWLFISNALCDALSIIVLILFFDFKENATVLALAVVCSALLSALTLSIRQSVIYGAIIGILWVIVAACLRILPLVSWPLLQPLSSNARWEHVSESFVVHRALLLEPVLFAAGVTLLSIFVGYLAVQGRDNRISAELNRLYTTQLRKLNDSIIEDMQNGLLVISADGVILTLNRQARSLFCLDNKQTIPRSITELSPQIAKRLGRWQHMQFNDSRTITINKNDYSLSFNPLTTHADMGLTLIMLESMEESYQRVHETRLAALGRLTAGIAHEIRNPLSSVQSAADILAEMSDDPRVHFLTDKMKNNTQRMSSIISDILNLFNNNARNTKLIRLNIFLERIISEAYLNNETNQAVIRADISATRNYAVFFDPGHLRQILHNLMLNAVKHAGCEQVEITLRTRISEAGRFLYIDIQDNGCGVAVEDEEKIFEPFFSKRQGTGLGLYLVREMCVANQAQIVYLQKKEGACFRLTMERYVFDAPAE